MILEGEIKDTKMSSFSSISKHSLDVLKFPLYFLYELLMSLRNLILTRKKFKRRTTVQITLDSRKCLRSTIWEHVNFE